MFKCSVTGVRKLLKINMGFAKLGEKNKLLAKMSVSTWRNFRVSILKNILHCITPMKVDCWMRSNELGLWSLQLLRGKGKDTLCWDGSDEWQRLTVDIFFDAWFPSSFSGMALFFLRNVMIDNCDIRWIYLGEEMQKIPARQRAPQESARWQFFLSLAWIIPLGKSREKDTWNNTEMPWFYDIPRSSHIS